MVPVTIAWFLFDRYSVQNNEIQSKFFFHSDRNSFESKNNTSYRSVKCVGVHKNGRISFRFGMDFLGGRWLPSCYDIAVKMLLCQHKWNTKEMKNLMIALLDRLRNTTVLCPVYKVFHLIHHHIASFILTWESLYTRNYIAVD